jgi:hypothetical protein
MILEAAREADRREGRKPRKGFGNIDSPINRFVYARVVRTARRAGGKVPRRATVFSLLREAAKPPRDRGLRPARTSHKVF